MQSITKPKSSLVFNYLKLIRGFNLFMVALTQYLTAIFLVSGAENWYQILTDKGFFLLVSSTVMITGAGYLINDYYDVKIDLVNKPQRVIVGKDLKRRWVIAGHTALNLGAVAIGFYLSITIGIINFGASFLLWIYSNQLKRLPIVGNLAVALLTGTTLILVSEYFGDKKYLILCYAVFATFITLIREIIKDMEDMKGDERFGCKTIPIVFGIAKTKWIIYLIAASFLITVFLMISHISMILPIGLLVMLIFLIFGLVKADTVKAYNRLSTLSKIIMLLGVISMIWI
ncbi:geranylgeranylglycerol-phosphate geranylgeranyltransferase [Roseivirga sp. E12]|uniref:geranylgeranylglycerol-phosphate geranylgeranyltransferase n=1 Tax=Roseivirga sp. E12 TaxID=2819237 RepID=UPI001ABCB9B8|nr:geranylgeranylglycerol-phosphate geranylgeranyltransferase [Roseivirga sp. E12]MBO3698966.1 geranylgeranylglycerol-phosphate geranylgeranyltransferase [Roseivirga sp. E12]